MDLSDPKDFWLLLAAAIAFAFILGRAMRTRETGETRVERRQREAAEALAQFNALTPDKQAEIDALVTNNRIIDAIKLVREETGMGLKESKDAVDARRKNLL
ncbi:MAG: ribosomal protein L7/L12 [Amphiplicatus sp.]